MKNIIKHEYATELPTTLEGLLLNALVDMVLPFRTPCYISGLCEKLLGNGWGLGFHIFTLLPIHIMLSSYRIHSSVFFHSFTFPFTLLLRS